MNMKALVFLLLLLQLLFSYYYFKSIHYIKIKFKNDFVLIICIFTTMIFFTKISKRLLKNSSRVLPDETPQPIHPGRTDLGHMYDGISVIIIITVVLILLI